MNEEYDREIQVRKQTKRRDTQMEADEDNA